MDRIAILGSGSWATALAKIILTNVPSINWYIRKQEVIDTFKETGRNPHYLTNAIFDTERINFFADINQAIAQSDILVLVVPSPYVKQELSRVRRSLRKKIIISAVKGMIPDENIIVTDWLHYKFNVPYENLAVIAGPCHAEEIALDRLSYLTIGCRDRQRAHDISNLFRNNYVHTTISDDVEGLEYSSVMKNIYSIAAGICRSLRYGDNFQAVLMSNAIQEIQRFTNAVYLSHRNIDASGYLGDMLVTAYSKFSRNRQFGQMIGMGYSVKAAQIEMHMIAEGYFGTKCIYLANKRMQVSLPILDAIYDILYNRQSPTLVIQQLTEKLV